MGVEEPPACSFTQSPDYGPVQLRVVSCSLEEAQKLHSVWSSTQFLHTGVMRIYEVYNPQLCEEGWRTGYLAQAVGSNLRSELEQRRAAGRNWREDEVMWVLRCVVDVMSQAEELGWAHCRLSLETIFIGEHRVLLSPFFRTSLSTSYHARYIYLSPELKAACLTGSTEHCDLFKADIYALGVVLLALTSMSIPNEGSIPQTIDSLSGYPTLHPYLKRLLADNQSARPSFSTLEREFQALQQSYIQSGGEDLQASLHPRKTAPQPVCAMCSSLVKPWSSALSAELRPFANFQENCCSLDCLEHFRLIALEDSLRTKGKQVAKVVVKALWVFVVPAAFTLFCICFPQLAPVARAVGGLLGVVF